MSATAGPARLVGVGVFVAGGLLLFTIGLFMIGDRQMAFSRKFTVYTEFAKITGLQPGTIVRVAGAKAGSVKAIDVPSKPGGKFRVRLEIAETLHPIVRTDSVASIQTEGLVGGIFLSVGAGTAAAPPAPESSTLLGLEPFEIADLMQQMSETVKKVNATIDLLQDDVLRAVKAIGATVDTTNDLLTSVGGNVKTMASAGARISNAAAQIAEAVRSGRGTVGKLVYDDELYRRATAVAKTAEDIAEKTRKVVDDARQAVASLQSKDGPIQGVTSNMKQTLEETRASMAGFAENMDALKRNFLVRGYFNKRGYFNLSEISPAEYRNGKLTAGGRRTVRVWLSSRVLFDAGTGAQAERLTDDGKARLESAIAPFLDRLAAAVLIVEGYSQLPTADRQFVQSRARAAIVREHLIGTFHLDPQAVGVMPLGNESPGSPDDVPWNGIALAVILGKS